VREVAEDIGAFLKQDLDVSRLNAIHDHMWACGRPLNARALNRQRMMNRQIVITDQADLHLLYHSDILFVKPLPAYLLCPSTWTLYFNKDASLHSDACGLLLSYIWLVRSPLDFKLAEEANLTPPKLTWIQWRSIVHEFLKIVDPNSLHQVNKRYHFGELRLHRINSAYRMIPRLAYKYFVRGYLYGYNRYKAFFQRSVGWVLVVFVWFSLILSAMQVGVTVPQLQGKQAFNNASFGFVVFSIVLVAALVLFVSGLFIIVFVYNMFAAIKHSKKETKRRKKLAEDSKKKEV
jgi:succinate dehydrogenase/fumarate reductase cytochrome b subunit